MEDKDSSAQISGTVTAVIYQNEENGYTVLRLDCGDGTEVTAVGCLPFAAPGERLIINGSWSRHPAHGEQFTAAWADRILPSGAEAIYDYLAGRAVKGIGPATACLIVNSFGDDSLDILENHPEKLAEIKGITAKKAVEMSENYRKQLGLRRLMEFLNRYTLRPQLAMRLYRFYGNSALEILKDNPYIISAAHIGGTFEEADSLAINLGFESDSPQRIAAAAVFELAYNSGNGHCFIPREKLVPATSQLIGVEPSSVEEGLEVLIDSGEVICEPVANVTACYLAKFHEAESGCAGLISNMSRVKIKTKVDLETLIEKIEKGFGIKYSEMQRQTLRAAASNQMLVITGGPGTGKTTSVRAILALFDILGLDTQLAAPTGRAAKRMSELTGREAVTIHRLLECGFSGDSLEPVFRRNEEEPLECSAVILDESSMVDITLMYALLRALPPDCRLVMVGDADQLPAVGPGNVFSDIIRSCTVETVRITEIFRQTAMSRIVESAHMINRGEHPDFSKNGGDFFFLRRYDPEATVDTIVGLCAERLPKNMGIPSDEIQVLTPTRRNKIGTANLNFRLQAALNPPAKDKAEHKFGERTFRVGDRVMQIRNNYDIVWKKGDGTAGSGIFNGDIGHITAISKGDELISVDFDDRTAVYAFDMLGELEHAFAMTVHKSQGSEYRAVVLCAGRGAPSMLLHRGLLYTGVTRARELLIIVGDEAVVYGMIDSYRQTRRYSGLRARLAALAG